ncbi:hypothetical protein HPULCUR_008754 [Helicostylum pulchrum]|uniref:Uncharacterized protein n=1 Tax=Helicostylum pulchrum TaxID=562976 RepID=A0ABP9Y939_9FUNG
MGKTRMTQYYFNLPSSQTTTNKVNDMPSQSILPPLTTEAKSYAVQTKTHSLKSSRAVTNDLNEVYNCASQISNQLLVGPSIINASAKNKTVHLPSISELDCMIDSTGRMMRVLDDAKHKWFIPSSPPLPVTQYRTVVSNIPQDGRTTITKRPRTLCNACGLSMCIVRELIL